jgi:hypothetical protein
VKFIRDDTPQMTSDGEFSVMLVPCPDPILATLYEGLPYLPCTHAHLISLILIVLLLLFPIFRVLISRLCEVKPFSGPLDLLRTPFAAKCNGLGPETVKCVYFLFL